MKLPRTALRRSTRRAFTLMEVLVVVAIIVVLASVATISFKYLSDSKYDVAKMKMKKIESAITAYKLRYGGNPPSDLSELTSTVDGNQAYLENEDILDPWGHPFILTQERTATGRPKIQSNGEPGANKPVSNW